MFIDWDAGAQQAFGLAKAIRLRRASAWNPQVPVIMVMAQVSAPALQQMRNSGVNEILLKPLTTAAVMDRLSRVILKPRPFVDCESYFGPERRRTSNRPFGGPFRRSADRKETLWV